MTTENKIESLQEKIKKYRTDLAPFCWKYGEQILFWAVYYVSGKWRRIKIRTFKTEAGAYRFYNSLPVD